MLKQFCWKIYFCFTKTFGRKTMNCKMAGKFDNAYFFFSILTLEKFHITFYKGCKNVYLIVAYFHEPQ